MTRLQNEYTFSFNRAYIAYKDWKFIPSFYSCIDKVVLPDNVNEINEMIKDNRFKDVLFFFPHWAEQFLLKREHVLFLKHIPGVKTFEENIQKLVILGGVGATSVQMAVYLGFKKIILLGCDCNYVEIPDGVAIDKKETARV